MDNSFLQPSKESDSESESDSWSFDKAINEVFRLLPEEICPKAYKESSPSKPLSGIECLMESRPPTLQLLPQSKLVEDTTKFIQNKLNIDKPGQDWICPPNIIKSLFPAKYYKSHPQFFPTQSIPALDSDASLLDISSSSR